MNHVTPSTLAVAPAIPKKEPGPWLRAWRKLKRNRKGMFGLYVVLLFIAMASFAPFAKHPRARIGLAPTNWAAMCWLASSGAHALRC